jgi:PAS domain S-box-containing protein
MKLNTRLLIAFALVGGVLLALVGVHASVSLRNRMFETIDDSFVSQLYQVDFALTNFLSEVEYDVLALASNETVRVPDDGDFTSFLEADEATFEYDIGEAEQAIIDLFNTYRRNHPYANSVYMGRENGSFVRSHPRARPTQYDPRQRPWYELGISSPDKAMRTEPYMSVTTPDVNIGTVKALVDEQGQVYGVVGIDVTLRNLTDYVSKISVGAGSHLVLLDEHGIVLTDQNEEAQFKRFDEAGLDYFQEVMDNDQGRTSFERDGKRYYLYYYTSPELGWKIGAVVPVEGVDRQAATLANQVVWWLAASLVLLSVLSAVAVRWFIVGPIKELQRSVETIMDTQDLDLRIAAEGEDEVGQLAAAFNEMVASIQRAGEDLRVSEEKYRSLVENLNVGVFRSSADGRLLHANKAAVTALGYDSVAKGMDVPVVNMYNDPRDREDLLRRLQEGEAIREEQLRLVKKDGTTIWVSMSVTAQFDREGRIKWLDGIIEDITERRAAEVALRRARQELEQRVAERTAELVQANAVLKRYAAELEARNAELDAFAHTVAHDLKNPLSNLVGYAEALASAQGRMTEDEATRYLEVIAQNGRKMIAIVDDLLLLSRVREREEIELQRLEMGKIVVEAQRRLQGLVEELEGEIVAPTDWPVAVGYAPWIEEVWSNYISNALKYGGRPPRIELGYTILDSGNGRLPEGDPGGNGARVRFWVRDNGPGLSPEEQWEVFTPFERLDRLAGDGHGLGLSIVQRIIYKLGGEVGVISGDGVEQAASAADSPSASNGGSIFYFTLPVAARVAEDDGVSAQFPEN